VLLRFLLYWCNFWICTSPVAAGAGSRPRERVWRCGGDGSSDRVQWCSHRGHAGPCAPEEGRQVRCGCDLQRWRWSVCGGHRAPELSSTRDVRRTNERTWDPSSHNPWIIDQVIGRVLLIVTLPLCNKKGNEHIAYQQTSLTHSLTHALNTRFLAFSFDVLTIHTLTHIARYDVG
jgi:hypothetical protein